MKKAIARCFLIQLMTIGNAMAFDISNLSFGGYEPVISSFCPYGGPWAYYCLPSQAAPTKSITIDLPPQALGSYSDGHLVYYGVLGNSATANQIGVVKQPAPSIWPEPITISWTSNAFLDMTLDARDPYGNLITGQSVWKVGNTIFSRSIPELGDPTQPQYQSFSGWAVHGVGSEPIAPIVIGVQASGKLIGGPYDGYIRQQYVYLFGTAAPIPEPGSWSLFTVGLVALFFGGRRLRPGRAKTLQGSRSLAC